MPTTVSTYKCHELACTEAGKIVASFSRTAGQGIETLRLIAATQTEFALGSLYSLTLAPATPDAQPAPVPSPEPMAIPGATPGKEPYQVPVPTPMAWPTLAPPLAPQPVPQAIPQYAVPPGMSYGPQGVPFPVQGTPYPVPQPYPVPHMAPPMIPQWAVPYAVPQVGPTPPIYALPPINTPQLVYGPGKAGKEEPSEEEIKQFGILFSKAKDKGLIDVPEKEAP